MDYHQSLTFMMMKPLMSHIIQSMTTMTMMMRMILMITEESDSVIVFNESNRLLLNGGQLNGFLHTLSNSIQQNHLSTSNSTHLAVQQRFSSMPSELHIGLFLLLFYTSFVSLNSNIDTSLVIQRLSQPSLYRYHPLTL